MTEEINITHEPQEKEDEVVEKKEEKPKKDNRTESVKTLEKTLLTTSWVKEAELIQEFVPEDDLTKNQQKLLQKCINREDFTDKQLMDLKLVLNKYRKILQKLKPQETVDSVDKAVQMMNTEKDFINMMSTDEQKKLLVHIKTYDGLKGFDFIVHPVNDSRVIETLEMQVDLFRDYTVEEQLIYSKASMGQDLTPDEERIYNKMNQEIIEKQSNERIRSINSFLANQLTLEGSDATLEDRIRFWELFPFNSKVGVFIRVQDMLGLSETKNSELFPTR